MKIYNVLGEEVATLVDEDRKAGIYQQALFDAARLATGVYLWRLEFSGKQLIKKMLFLKQLLEQWVAEARTSDDVRAFSLSPRQSTSNF